MYDVASAANVSHMTVSRAMNGQRGLSEATRERVLDVARVLGYVRNPAARALAGALPPRLGVILASSDPDASARVLRGFEGAAHLAGRTIAARSHEGDGDGLLARIAREFGDGGFSGLCVIADGTCSGEGRPADPPLVSVSLAGREDGSDVSLDRAAGLRAALDHLVGQGHEDIAFVGAAPGGGTALGSVLRDAGSSRIRIRVVEGESTSDFGFAVGSSPSLLGSATGVVAAHDRIALGLMHGLRRRGVAVPGEVSIIGTDDIADARHFLPALTTVAADLERLGRLAFAHLNAQLTGGPAPTTRVVVPRLVVRESVATSVDRSTDSAECLPSALCDR